MSDLREQELQQAKQAVSAGIDAAITTLRGSVEFRNAVEELLVGTPFEKPARAEYDFEGLYGRLRSALLSSRGGERREEEGVSRVDSLDGKMGGAQRC